MTVPCNTGFTEAAKFLVGEAADKFQYVGVGTGTGQGASNTKLATELTDTGLKRVQADTVQTTKTTIDNDTVELIETFTASGTKTVTEAGAFNNVTADAGDMLMVGDLSPSAPMVNGDTLKITMQCQIKSA